MKARLLSVLLAALIAGAAAYSPSAEIQVKPVQIDFASLHSQASSALQTLQTLQERRIALQLTNDAAF